MKPPPFEYSSPDTLEEALATITHLRRQSLAFTVDLLGEATITEAEADRYQAEYLRLIAGLSRTLLASYLPAFFVAGALCIVASLLTVTISRPAPKPAVAPA